MNRLDTVFVALRRDGKKNTECQKHSAIPRVALDYSLMAGMALRQASKKIQHYMPSKPWQALTLRKASKKKKKIQHYTASKPWQALALRQASKTIQHFKPWQALALRQTSKKIQQGMTTLWYWV